MNKTPILPLALAGVLGLSVPAMAKSPAEFLTQAVKGDTSEIMLGRLAEQKAASPAVRAYGQTLVHDHSQAREQANALAQRMSIPTPSGPMNKAESERMRLAGMSGAAFDHEFTRYMVNDHRSDLADFQNEARRHGPVARLARQTLPVLKKHLRMAEQLQRQGG